MVVSKMCGEDKVIPKVTCKYTCGKSEGTGIELYDTFFYFFLDTKKKTKNLDTKNLDTKSYMNKIRHSRHVGKQKALAYVCMYINTHTHTHIHSNIYISMYRII